MKLKLRQYQSRMLQAVSRVFAAGHRRLLVQMPTGAGKTLVAAELVRRAGARRVLYVVPSADIFAQTSEKLANVGCDHELLQAGGHPDLRRVRYLLAMSQTLAKRLDTDLFDRWRPDLIIVDEAHKLLDQHAALVTHWGCPVIALTATPVRLDGRDLHDLFPIYLLGPQVSALQAQRHLVAAQTYELWMPDLSTVGIGRGGDYRPSELDRHYRAARILHEVPAGWAKYARGRRTLAFTAGVEASKALTRAYLQAGVRAYHVDGSASQNERDDALRALRRNKIDVLCNCNLYTEGLDVVEIDAVQMVTSTRSLARYLQMAGRGLRLSPKTRKRDLIVLDHGGLAERFGLIDADRDWDNWGVTASSRLRSCKKCDALYPAWQRRCHECKSRTRRRRMQP